MPREPNSLHETDFRLNDSSPVGHPSAGKTAPIQERIRAVFLAPSTLPGRLSPDFPWLDVLLITTVIAMLGVFAIPDSAFLEPMQDAVTRRGDPVEVTSPPHVIARWGRIMGMLATLATHPAVALAFAGALALIFGVFLRGPMNFREYLGVATHMMLIPALGTLISIVIALITGGSGDVEAASSGSEGIRLVLSIDPAVIWMLIATGVAISAMDTRRSGVRAGLVLVGAYLVLSLAGSTLLDRVSQTSAEEVEAPGSAVEPAG